MSLKSLFNYRLLSLYSCFLLFCCYCCWRNNFFFWSWSLLIVWLWYSFICHVPLPLYFLLDLEAWMALTLVGKISSQVILEISIRKYIIFDYLCDVSSHDDNCLGLLVHYGLYNGNILLLSFLNLLIRLTF